MRLLVLTLLAGAALAVPAVADAKRGTAPPGNSGIDEYVESIPGPTGNRPTHRVRSRHPRSVLGAGARRRLAAQGPAGRAAARLAAATAPSRPAGTNGRVARQGVAAAEAAGGSGSADALTRTVAGEGRGGMGVGLPAILVGALALALARFLLRRRRRT